jgi:hypothetical protein
LIRCCWLTSSAHQSLKLSDYCAARSRAAEPLASFPEIGIYYFPLFLLNLRRAPQSHATPDDLFGLFQRHIAGCVRFRSIKTVSVKEHNGISSLDGRLLRRFPIQRLLAAAGLEKGKKCPLAVSSERRAA